MANGCSSLDLTNSGTSSFDSKPVDNRLAMGRLCESQNEGDQARKAYESVLRTEPKNATALHRLAVMASKSGQYSQAQEFFDRALAIEPNSAELANDMGYNYFLQDRLPEAEQQLRRAVELKPDYKAAWTNLGMTLGQQQKLDESRAAFQKGAKTPAEVHCNMAYVFTQLYRFDDAQAAYRAALNQDPNLRAAAEGLLQVSANIPGQEPVTVVSTIATKPKPSEAESQDAAGDQAADIPGSFSAGAHAHMEPQHPVHVFAGEEPPPQIAGRPR